MSKVNIGNDLYLKGRIGWRGLSKDEYLTYSEYKIINGYSLEDNLINWDICGYISKERFDESPEIKLQEKDILISKDGTLGKIGYVKNLNGFATIASGIFILRNIIEDRLNTDYLYHYLKSKNFKDFIQKIKAEGSTINHLYQRDLIRLEINVPCLRRQQCIASVLSILDNKIELNNRINVELETMAKTLYDYWFVQFDFPDINGKPYKSSGGKMVYNEVLKRQIPEGWEVNNILKIADLFGGGTPNTKNKDYWNGDIPFFTPSDTTKSVYSLSTLQYITTKGLNESSTKLFDKGTVFLTARGTVGNIMIASQKMAMNQSCYALVSKTNNHTFLYFTAIGMIGYLKAKSGGSVFNSIVSNDIKYTPVIIPMSKTVDDYERNTSIIFERILNNLKENQHLASLRDWLLPMLMNGQIGFKEIPETNTISE